MSNSNISMEDLYSRLDTLGPEELILDVREPDEYRAGHIRGSRNIPHLEVANHLEELKKYKKIYLHCQAGRRAGKAAQVLAKLGLNHVVCISDSGMGDWIAAGFPVVK